MMSGDPGDPPTTAQRQATLESCVSNTSAHPPPTAEGV